VRRGVKSCDHRFADFKVRNFRS